MSAWVTLAEAIVPLLGQGRGGAYETGRIVGTVVLVLIAGVVILKLLRR